MLDAPLLPVVFAAWNLLVGAVYAWDKFRAMSGGRRVPEKTLLLLAAGLGFAGAWVAVIVFRHKIRKPGFMLPLSFISGLWCVALWYWNPSLGG